MTAYRSTTDEMLAARFDPEPWAYSRTARSGDGPFGTPDRAATRIDTAMLFFPRPEYIPGRGHVDINDGVRWIRAVRPESNPVLVALRDDLPGLGWSRVEEYRDFLDALLNSESFIWGMDATPEQIEHAIRVLLRLVALG